MEDLFDNNHSHWIIYKGWIHCSRYVGKIDPPRWPSRRNRGIGESTIGILASSRACSRSKARGIPSCSKARSYGFSSKSSARSRFSGLRFWSWSEARSSNSSPRVKALEESKQAWQEWIESREPCREKECLCAQEISWRLRSGSKARRFYCRFSSPGSKGISPSHCWSN